MRQFKRTDKRNTENVLALTPMQEGMLFHYLKDPTSDQYFEQLSLEISGEIDVKIFEKAWEVVVETNEMLRTVFRWEKMKHPIQIVSKKHHPRPIYHDLSGIKTSEKNKLAEEIKINDRKKKFDLREVPFRVTLCKIETNKYQMIISNHHILYDGWSNGIILKEFFNVYNDLAHKRTPVKPVKNKFKEYIKWLKSLEKNKQEKFWSEYLKGVENHSELAVKTRRTKDAFDEKESRAGIQHTEKYQTRLSRDNKNKIERFVKKHRITLAALFYSSWGILLQKYNNSDDVLFGTTVSGRSAKVKGIEDMVGLFINTLPLRVKRNPYEPVIDVLNQVNQTLQIREGYENTSLADIKEYSPLGNPGELFDSLVVLENYPLERHLMTQDSELSIDSYSMVENTNYDLTVGIVVFDGIQLDFVYNTGCFVSASIEIMSGHFCRIMENIIKNPGKAVHEIDLLSEKEKRELLVDFNDTAADYPRDKTIHDFFSRKVEQTPDRMALVGSKLQITNYKQNGVMHLTYRELNEKSDQLAHLLIKKGVKPDTIVAIMVERSIEMVIGMLGILKAGGAYLPIDPGYPQDRIDYMLKDSGARTLLKGNNVGPGKSQTNPNEQNSNEQNLRNAFTVLDFERLNFEFVSNFEIRASDLNPANLAYIIYTSGSTGKPKGVLVEHTSAVNVLLALQKEYPFEKPDAYLFKTSVVFDVSVSELFGWFFGGGRLVILEKDGEKDPHKILDTIERMGITHINFVPAVFNVFIEVLGQKNIDRLPGLKYIFLAGEALLPGVVDKFKRLSAGARIALENIYGPTEGTVYASNYSLSGWSGGESVPIGKPMQNIRLYILDKDGLLQPVGVPGELYISGSGVARGYLNQPELTNKKFCGGFQMLHGAVFQKSPPGRRRQKTYRTGDLARWLPDGNIEFLGRMDHQIKIRGFRIELGEIESRLTAHPQIKEAVVTARDDKKGDKYLAAYIVIHSTGHEAYSTVSVENLREFLAQKLPDYMIPAYFVPIEQVPLTPNGKRDRKSLPEPGVKIHQEYAPPHYPVEEKLVEIWQEVLGIEKIGVNDNFFKLGGHSLKAAVLVSRISRDFNVEFPLGRVFANPTIKSFAKFINKAETSIYEVIRPVEKKEYYPLSSAQKRLLFLNQYGNTGTSYNMPAVVKIQDSPGKKHLLNVIETLIERHESLRTSIEFIDNAAVQRVHHGVEFKIEYYEAAKNDFVRSFDLSCPPLIRMGLAEISKQEYLLFFDMHHIISDGTSTAILMKEFTKLYAGENLPPLKIQYKDFCLWQKNRLETGAIRSQEDYWLSLYRGEIPGLNLPTDYPRPQVMTFEGDEYEFKSGPGGTLKFNALASAYDVTLFMNLMAVFNVLLYKYTGQDDIIVGGGLVGRSHADLQAAIGMFVNVLPMRHHPEGKKTYLQFLAEVKESGIKAHENQDFPFEKLVDKLKPERDLSRNPLFDVCLMVQNFETLAEKPINFTINTENIYHKVSRFDLTLFAMEKGEELVFQLEYSTKLFKPGTLQRLANHFLNIIRQVNVDPRIHISDLDILTTAEKQQLLYDFNDTLACYPRDKTLHRVFVEQVERIPDQIALVGKEEGWKGRRVEGKKEEEPFGQVLDAFGGMHISYKELNKKSDQLVRLLKVKGVKPDTIVGIMVGRSIEMIIGILGILKAGGAYLPIDPAHPEGRIDYMLSDSNVGVLLTTPKLQVKVKAEVEENFRQPQQQPLQLINIETELASAFDPPPSTLTSTSTCQVSPTNLAYVLYTSGSVGRPKGVLVEHGSLINVLAALNRYNPFDETCVYLMKTSYEFDVSAAELFGWFLGGGVLAILQKHGEKDPRQILEAIAKYGITHINFVPSMFRAFIDSLNRENIVNISRLRYIFLAGEALPGELVNRFAKLSPGVRLENIYGPTEAAIYASKYSLSEWQGGNSVPIGKPLPNVRLYIFDSYGHLQGIGIPGELGIAGAGVARGYLNKPGLTAEKFIFATKTQRHKEVYFPLCLGALVAKLYKTGDLARWLPDGNIEFFGRMDYQVKIRGFRIELGEIERQLLTHHEISDAIVVSREDQPGGPGYLCAYFVPVGGLSADGLREHLAGCLPGYMIPSYFVQLDKIPLTPNGKVDRKSLPAPRAFQRHLKAAYVPCTSGTEKLIEGIWKEVLKLEKVGIDDNFFDIGGNSINVLQVNNMLSDVLGSRLAVIEMFRYTTIRSLAQFLSRQGMKRDLDRKKWADTFKRSKIDIKQAYQKRKQNDRKEEPEKNKTWEKFR